MTSTSHADALKSEHSVKNITTMNATALMVFLLLFLMSTIAHAQHITEYSDNIEQQECHICHHNIDTPPEFPQIQPLATNRYIFTVNKDTVTVYKANNFVQPPLRAPPVI